jgi:hypothetical protein
MWLFCLLAEKCEVLCLLGDGRISGGRQSSVGSLQETGRLQAQWQTHTVVWKTYVSTCQQAAGAALTAQQLYVGD